MKIIKKNIFFISSFLLLCISNSFASSPPASEIGDWVLENSNYTMNGTTITLHGDIYLKTTSTITIEGGGNLEIGRFWTKRIPITISTCASPDIPDNYQIWVPTTVFTTTQWSDIKGGTGQADLDDVRFVSSMNATGYWESCPYWIEPDTTNPRGFWVKVTSITQANSNVYIYYGNASATHDNSQGGRDTFIVFDDFNGGTEQWTESDPNGLITIDRTTNHRINFSLAGQTNERVYMDMGSDIGDVIMHSKMRFSASGKSNVISNGISDTLNWTSVWNDGFTISLYSQRAGTQNWWPIKTWDETVLTYSGQVFATAFTNVDIYTTAIRNGSTYKGYMYLDAARTNLKGSGTITGQTLTDLRYVYAVTNHYLDSGYTTAITGWTTDIRIRQFAAGEPTIAAGTTEATPTTGYHIYVYPQGQIYQKQGSGINK